MNQAEFTARTDHVPTLNEWEIIERVYTYHPQIRDIGGKDQLAFWWKNTPTFSKFVYDFLPAANDAAEVQGYQRIRWIIPYWYGEEVIDETRGVILQTIPATLTSVAKYLNNGLGDLVDEYFSDVTQHEDGAPRMWPTEYTWLACYPVTGGSEGHYVHVDVIYRDNSRRLLFLVKTFKGIEHAWKIAQRAGELLHI